jgi:hypothetical protein
MAELCVAAAAECGCHTRGTWSQRTSEISDRAVAATQRLGGRCRGRCVGVDRGGGFQPPTSLSDASEHEVATGVLSDGSTVQAEMTHRKIRGPQKASGDRERPSTAEHDQPEIALGSEALQSPPAEQRKREAGLLLPRNRNRPADQGSGGRISGRWLADHRWKNGPPVRCRNDCVR